MPTSSAATSTRVLGFLRVLGLAAVVVALIGLFRLGRQFPAAAATPGLLVPFLKPVLAFALEGGALVALSASALSALTPASAGSLTARVRLVAMPLALATAIWTLGAALPRGTERPGALANDLIARAFAGCDDAAARVPVPLLGLEVRCQQPRRIEGPMPGIANVQLGMSELSFSDDLRRVRIVGLDLTAKRALRVHLEANTAQIAGLSPWTRSTQLSTLARLLLLGALGVALCLAACWWWRIGLEQPRVMEPTLRWRRWLIRGRRGLLLAAPGVVAAGAVIWLDQQRASPLLYGLAAAAAVVALLALRLLARYAPNSFSSFGNS